jgi:MAC/Perforin domain
VPIAAAPPGEEKIMPLLTVSQSEKSNAINWMSAGFNIYGAYDLALSTLPRKIFDPRKAPLGDETPLGKLPVYMAFRPLKTSDFFRASGDGRDAFQSKFAARASVDLSVGAFSGHVEAAYGEQVAESSQYSYTNMSFREALGMLVLDGLADAQYLTDEFAARLRALPDAAESNLERFAEFFRDFGAYFVSTIEVGATLEYYVALKQSDTMRAQQIKAKMEAEYNGLFVSGKATAEMSSDQEWKSYRLGKTAAIRIKGGGDQERDQLNQVDAGSLDSMSQNTVVRYNRWLDSVANNAAVMDFKLTGIWEVCGAKRKAVEDAFRQYGDMMRPKLHVETRTVPGNGYVPSVFLGGSRVPVDAVVDKGWGGYRLLVIDRRQPSVAGVRWSKLYSVPSGDGSQYRQVFDVMYDDLHQGGFVDNRYFFVLATYGAYNSFPPTPRFIEQMQEAGAGPRLARWIESAGGKIGTMAVTADVNYILVGIMKSGPGAGIEGLGLFPNTPPRTPRVSSVDVYFYSLGSGRPYVLGAAEVKA